MKRQKHYCKCGFEYKIDLQLIKNCGDAAKVCPKCESVMKSKKVKLS